jgi:hypothetical protein
MKKTNPKKTMARAETVLNALEQLAPNAVFGGKKLSDCLAQVNLSRNKRDILNDIDQQKIQAINDRDATDEETMAMIDLIINGVVGDPNYGPDSALYEAMGFVRKSARKSGLTRKKKVVTP